MSDRIYDICLLIQEGFSDDDIMLLHGVTVSELDNIRRNYYGKILEG